MENRDRNEWIERACQLGPTLAERAAAVDLEGRFVADNYQLLKEQRFLSALVPAELGGGGASYREAVHMLRELGHYCGSTALTLSMHSHLVAATVWKYRKGQPGEQLLRKLAAEQLVLVSTGAGDWLQSNGRAERVEGGYRIYGTKRFGSGSPVGDLAVSSIAYDCPEQGPSVLHFPLSLKADGVEVRSDWDSLGMRGTGSNTIHIEGAFVPDAAIALKRPREGWHPVWNVVLTVAPGLYMAPYVGVAEAAAERARQGVKKEPSEVALVQLGEMENQLMIARLALDSLIANVQEYDFAPDTEVANRNLAAKTLISNSCIAVVDKAMEILGGAAYLRAFGFERLLRDVRGAGFHPLPEKRQQLISGRLAVGLSPV